MDQRVTELLELFEDVFFVVAVEMPRMILSGSLIPLQAVAMVLDAVTFESADHSTIVVGSLQL